jgi:hypothetical protein
MGVIEARLDRARRDVEHLRDVIDLEVVVVAQSQYDAVVGLELRQACLDDEPVKELLGCVRRSELWLRVECSRPTSRRATQPVATFVDDDAPEPGFDIRPIAKARPSLPRPDEGVVDRVSCFRGIAEDGTCEPVRILDMRLGVETGALRSRNDVAEPLVVPWRGTWRACGSCYRCPGASVGARRRSQSRLSRTQSSCSS